MNRIVLISFIPLLLAMHSVAQSDTLATADSLKHISSILSNKGEFDNSIRVLKRAAHIYKFKNHKPAIASSYFKLGLLYRQTGQLDSSSYHFSNSKGYYETAHVKNKVFAINNQLLENAIALNDYSTAQQLYDENLSLEKSIRVHRKNKLEYYELGQRLGKAIDAPDFIKVNNEKYHQLQREFRRECGKISY